MFTSGLMLQKVHQVQLYDTMLTEPKMEQAWCWHWLASGVSHDLFSFAHYEVSAPHKHMWPVSLNLSDILSSKKHRGTWPFQAWSALLWSSVLICKQMKNYKWIIKRKCQLLGSLSQMKSAHHLFFSNSVLSLSKFFFNALEQQRCIFFVIHKDCAVSLNKPW